MVIEASVRFDGCSTLKLEVEVDVEVRTDKKAFHAHTSLFHFFTFQFSLLLTFFMPDFNFHAVSKRSNFPS
jgi:hypothetical protein